MGKTARANETADNRSSEAAWHKVPPGIGPGVAFIGDLLRLVRLRSPKDESAEHADGAAVSQQGKRPEHASDAARASMEAGITRGSSLLFSGFSDRK